MAAPRKRLLVGAALVAAGLPVLVGAARVAPASVGAVPTPHDLHIVYGDFAVEGPVIAGRMRFFKHDLERALGPMVGADALSLSPGTEADALVMRYVRERLHIRVEGEVLAPALLDSGMDELDRHPVWWIVVQYRAPSPPDHLTIQNRLLHEVFDDQRNIFKFMRFPEQEQETYYFTAEEPEQVVRLR